MTAVQLSISIGNDGLRNNDFTVGTSAPGTGDIELRWNQTSNGYNVTAKEIVIALKAFIRVVEAYNSNTYVSEGIIGPP